MDVPSWELRFAQTEQKPRGRSRLEQQNLNSINNGMAMTKEEAIHAILITGGAGFLGSHLSDLFNRTGAWEVIALDNLITGWRENIAHLVGIQNSVL